MRITSVNGKVSLFVRSVVWNDKVPRKCTMVCNPWDNHFPSRAKVADNDRWVFVELGKDPVYVDLLTVELENQDIKSTLNKRMTPFVGKETRYVMTFKETFTKKVNLDVLETLGLTSLVDKLAPTYTTLQKNRKHLIIDTDD